MRISDIENWVERIFLEAGFKRELSHGIRHWQQVRREFQILCKLASLLDGQLKRCLKIAVDVHDIGHIKGGHAHAVNSAKIFSGWDIEDLDLVEKEAIIFAVANHSCGLVGLGIKEPKTLREKILGLLVVCDHLDAASPEGAARIAIFHKGCSGLLGEISKKELVKAMELPPPFKDLERYKNDSVLSNWVWEYAATGPIIQAVDSLITEEFREYIEDRLKSSRALIDLLLEF